MIMLALLISAIVGLSVVLFVAMTERLSAILLTASATNRFVSPLIGSLFAGWLLYRFFPDARGSGIPQTRVALILHKGFISVRTIVGKFVCSSISLGSGVALGREGPSVHIGAGLASVIGRKLGLTDKHVKALVPVGTAAAVAAAFNTPLAAVLFTLEEILADLHARLVGTVVIGAATSWMILRLLLGDEPLFHVPPYELVHPIEFAVYAVLGVAGGFISTAFVKLLLWQRSQVLRIGPPWRAMTPALGGLTVGLLAFLHPGVLGVGYNLVSDALNGRMELQIMLILLVLKLVATATCYGSGNAGGIFGPSLFIGAMLGGAIGEIAHIWLPDQTGSVGAYALVGMGAAFAGIVRTPMTSVIMIFEVTRDYTIIVPLMLSNLCSYLIAKRMQPVPLYEALSQQEGISMPSPEHLPEPLAVEQAVLAPWEGEVPAAPSVYPDDPLEAALQLMGGAGIDRIAVLNRAQGMPIGVLRFEDAIHTYKSAGTERVEDAPRMQVWIRTVAVATFAVALIVIGLVLWQRSRQSGVAQEAYLRGEELQAKGQLDQAVSAFRSALARDPENIQTRRLLGLTLVDSGHLAEAKPYLAEVARAQPQDGAVASAEAKIAWFGGEKQQALQFYRKALAADWQDADDFRHQQTVLDYANLLVDLGRRDDAASALLAGINASSVDLAFGNKLASMIQMIGTEEQVEAALLTLTRHFPDDVGSWMKLGDTLFADEKDPQALDAYQKAAAIDPTNADAVNAVKKAKDVFDLDPSRRNLSARARAERWDLILMRMLQADESCLTAQLREMAAAVLKKKTSSLAVLDQKATAAQELWSNRNSCPADPVLEHIFGKLAR